MSNAWSGDPQDGWIDRIVYVGKDEYGRLAVDNQGTLFRFDTDVTACWEPRSNQHACGLFEGHGGPHVPLSQSIILMSGSMHPQQPSDLLTPDKEQPTTTTEKPYVNVIGLCGYARSGKDTLAASLKRKFGFERLAFADTLRTALYRLNPPVVVYGLDGQHVSTVQHLVGLYGWDTAKVAFSQIREMLQRLGTEVGREMFGVNFWVDQTLAQIEPRGGYVVTDCRFPNEAEAIRAGGGFIVRINRPGVQPVNSHASDLSVDDIEPDMVVSNDGSLDSVDNIASSIIEAMSERP